jgi:hypothetical protein
LADVGWTHGSLVEPKLEEMPDVPGDEAAKLLDQAEDIINAVGPDVLADVRKQDEREERKGQRWWRRKR